MKPSVTPFSLKDAPALIERLLPVQKLSAEAYKEQMAGSGKTLTGLGSYWKGRKPLILSKACVLGCLLPATDNPRRDLEIFEKLMAMDGESFVVRSKRRATPKEILNAISLVAITEYFNVEPVNSLPIASPADWSKPEYASVRVTWREDIPKLERLRIEVQMLPKICYRKRVFLVNRPEEVAHVHDHIWETVNFHLGTRAFSFPELIEQLGIMRFGRRPKFADTFCGSGQIAFEAARLGCNVHSADLNPIACMLTWGAFNIVGGSLEGRAELRMRQQELIRKVQDHIDTLNVECDGRGWRAKAFLYCLEARCPQTGWLVPLLPSLVISKGTGVLAELVPDQDSRCYHIRIRSGVSGADMAAADKGTVQADAQGLDAYITHSLNGREFRTKFSTLRGDYRNLDGSTANRLRAWEKSDITPSVHDIFQERLYCVQWMRAKQRGKGDTYEFRAVLRGDLSRENRVETDVSAHLSEWQQRGWIPDMRIESGAETDRLYRERGWTYWHHLFNPRQLLIAATIRRHIDGELAFSFCKSLNVNARLSRWDSNPGPGRSGKTQGVFDNQALNTLFNYACRSASWTADALALDPKKFPLNRVITTTVSNTPAASHNADADIYVTDPPYGDAVKYEEILEFFIAWLRENPPPEFADWIWDSRRSLAIKGEDEEFRRGMVAAYKRMTECMPDNGIQVIMFTHQSGSIWADMANLVWASGLQVTAAWYVVTETESALRQGSNVKGTVLLVVRKRRGSYKTTRDDLAWEIQDEVDKQVQDLSGLNQEAKGLYRDENVFEDADIQMAGYAAALRVLTRYAIIDGRDMTVEAVRPRVKGEKTFVDSMIDFAVSTANQCLVPQGIAKFHWNDLTGAERFYLKLLDLEAKNFKTLDNYYNVSIKHFR